MDQEIDIKRRVFMLDYDKADDAAIMANLVIIDIAKFEHEITLKLRDIAKASGKNIKSDAIKILLLEAYQRRISCLMNIMEGKNGN